MDTIAPKHGETDPACHPYEQAPSVWSEMEEGHFILANQQEFTTYRDIL